MPMYQYVCEDCGKEHSQMHKWGETPELCICGSDRLTRQMGAPALRTGGLSTLSTRHTTSEYYGPNSSGGTMRLAREEFFPEERKRKAAEEKKKKEGKGATVSGISLPGKSK